MTKSFFFSVVISIFFVVHANAWDMGAYVTDTNSVWEKDKNQAIKNDSSKVLTNAKQNEIKIKHHAITLCYGVFTLTDFAAAFRTFATAIFSLGEYVDEAALLGAFSLDYGYKFDENFETGLVFNLAHPTKSTYTYSFMPKFRLNFNGQGFIRPFFEADAGFMIIKDDFLNKNFGDEKETKSSFIFNVTFAGLEIGHYVPITLGLISLGQRGLFYAGLGFHF